MRRSRLLVWVEEGRSPYGNETIDVLIGRLIYVPEVVSMDANLANISASVRFTV
jgi:hypothetical protein